nr:subtilisin-like protease SBT1.4 [Ipomoea batatas]
MADQPQKQLGEQKGKLCPELRGKPEEYLPKSRQPEIPSEIPHSRSHNQGSEEILFSLQGVVPTSNGYATQYFHEGTAIGAFGAMEHSVVISCSAGNSGLDPFTAVNFAPWILTVGGSTIDRTFPTDLVLGDGRVFTGMSLYSGELLGDYQLPVDYGCDANNTYCYSGNLTLPKSPGRLCSVSLEAISTLIKDLLSHLWEVALALYTYGLTSNKPESSVERGSSKVSPTSWPPWPVSSGGSSTFLASCSVKAKTAPLKEDHVTFLLRLGCINKCRFLTKESVFIVEEVCLGEKESQKGKDQNKEDVRIREGLEGSSVRISSCSAYCPPAGSPEDRETIRFQLPDGYATQYFHEGTAIGAFGWQCIAVVISMLRRKFFGLLIHSLP